ncbi:hypothetical protein TNCT_469541 [Trichonephila clavata]|uniref:Uncharacterized protein n=1 Tax=Trichonephila clavata TaxID=2740835 RepID=A0A8X6FHF4_TRICU|nr:hypothetical protein TNCT_469541 [Trichonephila clavata]
MHKKSAAETNRVVAETYIATKTAGFVGHDIADWFQHFKNHDFNVEDQERSGSSKKMYDKELEELLDQDPCQMLAGTVSKRLKALGIAYPEGKSLSAVCV